MSDSGTASPAATAEPGGVKPAGPSDSAAAPAGTATAPSGPGVAPAGTAVALAGPSTAPAPLGPVKVVPQPMFGPQWPGPGSTAPQSVLVAVLVSGVVAAIALPWSRPGIGWLITGLAVAVSVGLTALSAQVERGPRDVSAAFVAERVAWGLATLALLAVGAIRAAPYLFVLCVITACVTGALAVAGGRTLRGLFLAVMAVPLAALRALPWVYRAGAAARGRTRASAPSTEAGASASTEAGASASSTEAGVRAADGAREGRAGGNAVRTALAVVIGAVLLLVFGALLAGADPAFARILDNILPTVDAEGVARWIVTFVAVGLSTMALCFLALAPPRFDGEPGRRRGSLRRIEWAVPVGALVALFAGFVAVQATVLFGGREHVLRTAGLTYAEYARTGFWQLLTVTALTLLVLAVAARLAARETASDRIWLRALLGSLALLTLVIVASAMSRMWAYEQAYGFTRLRLLVSVCEVWLGVVFVLVLLAGIRLGTRSTWLPAAVFATAVAALLSIAVLNPDRFIAERNVIRFEETGRVDLYYLRDLSADAVPALNRLPELERACVLHWIQNDLTESASEEEWRHWNLGREQARRLLVGYTSPYDGQVSSPCYSLEWNRSGP
jgi:hypothetical protein